MTQPTYEQLQDKLRRCLQKLGESDVRLGETMGRLNAATCRAYDAEEDVRLLRDIREVVEEARYGFVDEKLAVFERIAGWLAEDDTEWDGDDQ